MSASVGVGVCLCMYVPGVLSCVFIFVYWCHHARMYTIANVDQIRFFDVAQIGFFLRLCKVLNIEIYINI